MSNKENTGHHLSLKNRSELNMTGITEVISYNDDRINLKSEQGNLNITGQKLNIKKLNLDEAGISIEGYITEIKYDDKKNKKGFIKKIFIKKNS